jgi:hypothetical protein
MKHSHHEAQMLQNGQPMRPSQTTTALTITLTLALALTACTAIPAGNAPSNESPAATTTTPADAAVMLPDPDERHVCGQVSALQGIWYRSDWEHDQNLIDDAAYASRLAAIKDGWRYLPTGGSDITPAIKDAQRTLVDGDIRYENTDFQIPMDAVARACDDVGSLIAIATLPGPLRVRVG